MCSTVFSSPSSVLLRAEGSISSSASDNGVKSANAAEENVEPNSSQFAPKVVSTLSNISEPERKLSSLSKLYSY